MFKQFSLSNISINTAESKGDRYTMDDKMLPSISMSVPFEKDTLTLHTSVLFDGHGGDRMATYLQNSFEKCFKVVIDKISNRRGILEYSEEWDEIRNIRETNPHVMVDLSTCRHAQFKELMEVALKATFQLLNDRKPCDDNNTGSTAIVCVIYEIWGETNVLCAYVGKNECYIVYRDGRCYNMTEYLHCPCPTSRDRKRAEILGPDDYPDYFMGPNDTLLSSVNDHHTYGNFGMTRSFVNDLKFGYQPTVKTCGMPQDVLGIYIASKGIRGSNGEKTENGEIVITPSSITQLIVEYYQSGITSENIPKCLIDYAQKNGSTDNSSVIWIANK